MPVWRHPIWTARHDPKKNDVKFTKLPTTPFTMIDLATSNVTSDTGTFTLVCAGAIQQANQARGGFIRSNNPILLHSDAGLSS
jgi:hypothetical protein